MGRTSKYIALIIVVILAISILAVVGNASATAQTIPKPAVPEFTLNFLDKSYDVAPIAIPTTNPYNNKTSIRTIPGYHVQDFEIEVTIKNQPFPTTIGGNGTNLYYAIATKGHFENWTNNDFPSSGTEYSPLGFDVSVNSSSDFTVTYLNANNYKPGDQVDIKVRAVLGYAYSYPIPEHIIPVIQTIYVYNSSDWSSTQTFTMPSISDFNYHNPTFPVFSVDLLLRIVAALAVVALVSVVLLLLYVRHLKRSVTKPDNSAV
jgi:hypothetical protein